MTGPTPRLARLKTASTTVGVLMMLTGVALAVCEGLWADVEIRLWMILGGCFVVLAGLVVIIASALLLKIESNTFRFYSLLLDMHELSRRHGELLSRMAENSALSDAAKSLTNRDQEAEALRTAIRADLRTERWEAALALVDGMEGRFGYAEEAANLRKDINDARVEAMRQKLSQATAIIETHLDACEWDQALHEIERLHRALPDEPRVAKLRALYDTTRAARKSALLKDWDSAVERDDVDRAIEVLQDLDSYLTREEARLLEESAREVFKAKLLQLRMQFQFAVNDQRWRDALEIGVHIIEEFPNSRMSHEVAEAMDGLRKRAGLHGDIEVTTTERRKADSG